MVPSLDAFFQPAPDGGQRLYLHHQPPPGVPLRGAVVYLHPWAEEMNKARRMAALASRALAADGWAVLQIDLLGCGDSSGDFGDATWQAWVDDATQAAEWMQRRYPDARLWLWGLRAGALLAAAAAPRLAGSVDLLLWQPVQQGKAVIQQFMRLKAAAQLADGGGGAILTALRADLAAGRPVEIAGYTLSPGLAQGLDETRLAPPLPRHSEPRVVWLETSTQPDAGVSPAARAATPQWEAAGWRVDLQVVAGPAFWQTTEIEDAPDLIDATVRALRGHRALGSTGPTSDEARAA